MTHRRSQRGFTLIELLIALVLAGIVALLFLEGMRLSAAGLGRLSARTDASEARSNLDDVLRRELGAAFDARLLSNAPALSGGPHSLRFLALASDGGAGLYRVRLDLEARQLVLTRRRVDGGGAVDAGRTVLASGLADVTIAYFGAATPGARAQWQDEWDGRYPPSLVRIALDAGDGRSWPPLIVRLWTAGQ